MKDAFRMLFAAVVLCLSQQAAAGPVTGLVTFTANTPAKAAEVNQNFAAVKTAVDDSAATIATLQGQLATLQSTVAALQAARKGPQAYAVVELQYDPVAVTATPVLNTARSYNITSVRRPVTTPGAYCLMPGTALDPATTPAVATPDWGLTSAIAGEQFFAYVDTTRSDCNVDEFEVVTNTPTGAGRSVISFVMLVP